MASTYSETSRLGTGQYSNDYLFSTLPNWSGGALPTGSTTAVTLNMAVGTTIAVDDTANFGALTFNNSSQAATLLIGGSLTATTIATTSGSVTTKILAGGTLNFTGATAFGASSTVSVAGILTGTVLSFYQQSNLSSLSVTSGGSITATSLDLTDVLTTSIASGGNLTAAVILDGGTLDVAGTATLSSLTLSAGTFTVEGTASVGNTGDGTFTVNQGGHLTMGATVSTLINNKTPTTAEVFNINGGKLTVAGNAQNTGLLLNSSFNFGSAANGSFDVGIYSATGFAYAITSLVASDSFEIGTQKFTSETYSGTTLTLAGGGSSLQLTNITGANLTTASFHLSTATDGGTTITVSCFLAGSRIETTRGEVAIEALAVGDEVVTLDGALRGVSRVRWLGHSVIDATVGGVQSAPIRIRAHAFAPDQPRRDLLVTPEHCILVEGGLIPARMLVNDISILREPGLGQYDVHHVECERHVILFAEGLTTESYLDTGTSGNFGVQDRAAADWTADAAAPLTTAREVVEPIWRRLRESAGAATARQTDAASDDPDLRLCLTDGSVLRARNRRGSRHFFVLPEGTVSITLLSRSAVPAEIEGPFVDDRRRLGVQVSRALLWNGLATQILPLADGSRSGWHAREAATDACWTDGRAELGLPPLPRPTILEIELGGIPHYHPHPRARHASCLT
nr:Hint domain-containing protein [uncultured Lichenicoccus sp.]